MTPMATPTFSDLMAQRADYHIRYERWRDNRLVESQIEPMAQRYWGKEEFALALAATGFSDVSMVGNYSRGRSVRANDRNITYEAVKA